MLELLPNPYKCETFYQCTLTYENGKWFPAAIERPCAMGHNETLFYNFKTCTCEKKEETECFDHYDKEHLESNDNESFLTPIAYCTAYLSSLKLIDISDL